MTTLLSELAKVRELSEKATPGEWVISPERHCWVTLRDGMAIAITENCWKTIEKDKNAALIVAAVNFLRTHAAAIEGLARKAEWYDWVRENYDISATRRGYHDLLFIRPEHRHLPNDGRILDTLIDALAPNTALRGEG